MALFIHIGIGKTGTTAIQDFFFSHRAVLGKAGLTYPEAGLRGTGHHALAELGATQLSQTIESNFFLIAEQLQNNQECSILISSENFCFMNPSYIHQMAEIFKEQHVKILFYVRTQVRLVESTYLEFQKSGHDYKGNIGSFFLQHRTAWDFNIRIAPWVNSFGEQAIMPRLFGKRIIGKDVRADFLELLGIRCIIEEGDVEKSNISLLSDYSNLVRLIDQLSPHVENRKAIMEELLSLSRRFKKTPGFSLIDAELQRDITEYYADSNRHFAERFLDAHQSSVLLSI